MASIAVDQFSETGEYIRSWKNANVAALNFGTSCANILRSVDHPTIMTAGFYWKQSIEQTRLRAYNLKCVYTEAQRKEFDLRIKKNMPIVYNLLKKYDFGHSVNRDDYIQEALTYAWIQFYSYKSPVRYNGQDFIDGGAFGAWFKITCRWGMLNYHNYITKWKYHEYEDWRNDEPEEEDMDVANTLALYHCIEDLTYEDRRFVYSWLNDKSIQELMEQFECTSTAAIHKRMKKVKVILRTKLNFYLYGIRNTKLTVNASRHPPIPVEQYTLDGKFIEWFPNVESVRQRGFNPTCVSNVVKNKSKKHAGFFWKYGAPQIIEGPKKDIIVSKTA